MKIKLDGKDFAFKLEDEHLIGEVLGKIEEACKAEKCTVTQVHINGKNIAPEELDTLFKKSADEDITLELFTINGMEVKNMMKEMGKKFIKNAEEMESIPIKIQNGKDAEAVSLIENFTVNLHDFYSAVKLLDIADIPETEKFGEKTIPEYHKELFDMLNNILAAIQNKDSVEISDIAEYELSPLVKNLGNGLLSIEV